MLTQKQRNLLFFISERLKTNGVVPSFDEMREGIGLKSKSGIHRLISSLEERGYIRRLPHRARALEILKMPEFSSSECQQGQSYSASTLTKHSNISSELNHSPFSPNVITGNFQKELSGVHVAGNANSVTIPLCGKIAAGTPIEALNDASSTIDIPASMLTGGEHYALTIEGDSMIEAGINDGDTVLIRKTNSAENGAIVVALVDQTEATLKRLRKKGDSIALEPANINYETRIFGPDRISVQGQLDGLFRRY